MRVVLTGARGFVGRQLRSALAEAGHTVTAVVRRPAGNDSAGTNSAELVADLRSANLTEALRGHDFVVHAASTTHGPAQSLWEGNVYATERLVDAARKLDVPTLYLSTSGVYGRSFGFFGDPTRMTRRPSSPLSQARAAAEDLVHQAGGTVIRPHVVFGDGDRWVAPPLARFMMREAAWLGSPDVRVAAISTHRLAEGITALLGRPSLPSILHASEPAQVTVESLIAGLFRAAQTPLPTRSLAVDAAFAKLHGQGVTLNALRMLGLPSRMDSEEFWGQPAADLGPTARNRLASTAYSDNAPAGSFPDDLWAKGAPSQPIPLQRDRTHYPG